MQQTTKYLALPYVIQAIAKCGNQNIETFVLNLRRIPGLQPERAYDQNHSFKIRAGCEPQTILLTLPADF